MKLNYKRTFFIGLAFMSICAFWQLYDSILPLMLKNTFLLKETMTGVVMAADNVLALILLPVFGALSDKTVSRMGKRTPFILIGTILAVLFMVVIPFADLIGNFAVFFVALAMLLLSMGLYRSPAVALMPDLTPKPLRSKANAVINLMGALGGVYALGMIALLVKDVDKPDYTPVFISVAALMIVAVAVLLLTIREKKLSAEIPPDDTSDKADVVGSRLSGPVLRSLIFLLTSVFLWFMAYNAVTTAYSRYVEEVFGITGGGFAYSMLIATVAAVLSYIPVGFISTRFGRKVTIISGIGLMLIAYVCISLMDTYNWLIYIMLILLGIGWAAINVNSYPMVVQMSRGSSIGRYTGFYYFFSMAAQIVTPILSGALIEGIGYGVLFPYSAVFATLSMVTMLFVRHGDSKTSPKRSVGEYYESEES